MVVVAIYRYSLYLEKLIPYWRLKGTCSLEFNLSVRTGVDVSSQINLLKSINLLSKLYILLIYILYNYIFY